MSSQNGNAVGKNNSKPIGRSSSSAKKAKNSNLLRMDHATAEQLYTELGYGAKGKQLYDGGMKDLSPLL